jgi:very-short-patch-repair endonuclease
MSRIHYKEFKGISLLARDLRNNQTPAEKLLWEVLRRKGLRNKEEEQNISKLFKEFIIFANQYGTPLLKLRHTRSVNRVAR